MNAVGRNRIGGSLRHLAFQYRDADDFVADVGEFVLGGLAEDAAVLIAVPGAQADALRRHLITGDTWPDHATVIDMQVHGRNPGRILSLLCSFVGDHAGRPVRIVGEQSGLAAVQARSSRLPRHDALINLAFDGTSTAILCPYDSYRLPAAVVADSERTHGTMLLAGGFVPSPNYTPPLEVDAECDHVPWDEPVNAHRLPVSAGGLAGRCARGAPISPAPPERRRTGSRTSSTASKRPSCTRSPIGMPAPASGSGSTQARWPLRSSGAARGMIRWRAAFRPPRTLLKASGLWLMQQVCDLFESRAMRDGSARRPHLDVSSPTGRVDPARHQKLRDE